MRKLFPCTLVPVALYVVIFITREQRERETISVHIGKAYEDVMRDSTFPVQAKTAIYDDDITYSVQQMARRQQLNILQPVTYDSPYFAALMSGTHTANQISVVTGLISGVTEKIQLILASQCKARDNRQVSFSDSANANLASQDERMKFVLRTAGQFDDLLKTLKTHGQLEQSINEISNGGGVKP